MAKSTGKFQGWNLAILTFLFLFIFSFTVLRFGSDLTVSIRILIRLTARLSLVLFSMTFAASSAVDLWPQSKFFRWLAQNRRYLGVSFAVSHLFHLAGIVGLGFVDTENFFATTLWTSFVFGGLVYVFIILMLMTSFARPAGWISKKQWNLLHKTGSYSIWLIFMISYFGRVVAMQWIYLIPAFLILSTVIVRFVAWKKKIVFQS